MCSAARVVQPIPRIALCEAGVIEVEPALLAEHVLIDHHWEAVAWFALTDDERPLRSFAALHVRGLPLTCSANEIRAWPTQVRANADRERGSS